jgi:peptide/nickel transport system permease protein
MHMSFRNTRRTDREQNSRNPEQDAHDVSTAERRDNHVLTEGDPVNPQDADGHQRYNRRQLITRRFLRNKTAVVGLIGFILIVLFAIFGNFIAQWGYTEVDSHAFLKGPSADHWLGTTQNGRDVLAMTVAGLRKSLVIGISVAAIQTVVAALVGAAAAYFGKAVDTMMLWVIDLLLVIPSFLLIAIITQKLGGHKGSTLTFIFLLAAFGWMLTARVIRSMTLSVISLDYVRAAKYMSVPAWTIIVRHIIPNVSSYLIVDATLGVVSAVMQETVLSYFGFGVQPPETSLGTLLADGQTMATTFPWIFLAPATVLTLMLVFINFMGDGLRDAIDPSSKSGGEA